MRSRGERDREEKSGRVRVREVLETGKIGRKLLGNSIEIVTRRKVRKET